MFEVIKLAVIMVILLFLEWIFTGDLSFDAIRIAIMTILIFGILSLGFKDFIIFQTKLICRLKVDNFRGIGRKCGLV